MGVILIEAIREAIQAEVAHTEAARIEVTHTEATLENGDPERVTREKK